MIFEFDVLSNSGQLSKVTVKADTEGLAYAQLFRQVDALDTAEVRIAMIAAPEASEVMDERAEQIQRGIKYLQRKLQEPRDVRERLADEAGDWLLEHFDDGEPALVLAKALTAHLKTF
jgi:hypothetical protein